MVCVSFHITLINSILLIDVSGEKQMHSTLQQQKYTTVLILSKMQSSMHKLRMSFNPLLLGSLRTLHTPRFGWIIYFCMVV